MTRDKSSGDFGVAGGDIANARVTEESQLGLAAAIGHVSMLLPAVRAYSPPFNQGHDDFRDG